MFTKGQLIFAALFFVSFVAITIWSYRKELLHHKKTILDPRACFGHLPCLSPCFLCLNSLYLKDK